MHSIRGRICAVIRLETRHLQTAVRARQSALAADESEQRLVEHLVVTSSRRHVDTKDCRSAAVPMLAPNLGSCLTHGVVTAAARMIPRPVLQTNGEELYSKGD